jgi:hypothetical protein
MQGGQFLLNGGKVISGLADLPNDADEFGANSLACYCLRAVLLFVEYALEGLGVSRLIGAVSLSRSKVGMDTPGNFTEQPLEVRRRSEVVSFGGLAVGVFVGLACLFAGLLCLFVRGGGRIRLGLQLENSCIPFVQLSVETPHLP